MTVITFSFYFYTGEFSKEFEVLFENTDLACKFSFVPHIVSHRI